MNSTKQHANVNFLESENALKNFNRTLHAVASVYIKPWRVTAKILFWKFSKFSNKQNTDFPRLTGHFFT